MKEKAMRSMSKVACRFFSGTLFSRFTGMVRDIVMADLFGVHPSMGAFLVAFRLSNLLRRFVAEGSLQSAFIPSYEKARLHSPFAGSAFFRDTLFSLTAVVFCLILLVEGALFLWGTSEVATLTALIFPALLFIVLYSLNSSLLLCQGEAFTLSAAPSLLNFFWIGGMWLLRYRSPQEAMVLLAIVVVIGYALQWGVTLPQTVRALRPLPALPIQLFRPEVRVLWRKIVLGMFGIGATQLNSFLDTLFAHAADPSGPIYLWYAARLEQLPLALFGIACMNSFIPPFSRSLHRKDTAEAKLLLGYSLEALFTCMFICTAGIWLLGGPSVNLLFCRGQFRPEDAAMTTYCLWAYGLGLIPAALSIFLAALFNAEGNFRLPSLCSFATVAINVGLNALFVFVLDWGAVSIALATTISAMANALLLAFLFFRSHKGWSLWPPSLFKMGGVVVLASLPTAMLFSPLALQSLPIDFLGQLQALLVPATLFLLFLGALLVAGKVRPLYSAWFKLG